MAQIQIPTHSTPESPGTPLHRQGPNAKAGSKGVSAGSFWRFWLQEAQGNVKRGSTKWENSGVTPNQPRHLMCNLKANGGMGEPFPLQMPI